MLEHPLLFFPFLWAKRGGLLSYRTSLMDKSGAGPRLSTLCVTKVFSCIECSGTPAVADNLAYVNGKLLSREVPPPPLNLRTSREQEGISQCVQEPSAKLYSTCSYQKRSPSCFCSDLPVVSSSPARAANDWKVIFWRIARLHFLAVFQCSFYLPPLTCSPTAKLRNERAQKDALRGG